MATDNHTAAARGTNLVISKKFSVEVARFIRGKNLSTAKRLMSEVIAKRTAVPFRRYNRDLGHKRGRIAAGRYPVKTAKVFLKLLESAEMNATNKGLDVERLYVQEITANKGTGAMRFGRQRGREAKRTHVDLVVEEREGKKKEAKKVTPKKKEEKKPPVKEAVKIAPKAEKPLTLKKEEQKEEKHE